VFNILDNLVREEQEANTTLVPPEMFLMVLLFGGLMVRFMVVIDFST